MVICILFDILNTSDKISEGLHFKTYKSSMKAILCKLDSLPNDKILALTKFKAFADDKIIVTIKLEFVVGKVENIVGKGENAGD